MKYLILMLLMLMACDGEDNPQKEAKPCFWVADSIRVAQQAFILGCIEKANPKSDEEPEDWISACENTSWRVFGKLHKPDDKEIWGTNYYVYLCEEAP